MDILRVAETNLAQARTMIMQLNPGFSGGSQPIEWRSPKVARLIDPDSAVGRYARRYALDRPRMLHSYLAVVTWSVWIHLIVCVLANQDQILGVFELFILIPAATAFVLWPRLWEGFV